MNYIDKNPFSRIRAEQMGESAWKYFVEPSMDFIGAKPLIFGGSRGTGKTMFFKCNSWKEKFEEAKAAGKDIFQYLNQSKHIGFYYKVDGRFVKSLGKKNIEETAWVGIFNTYFNVIIAKEILAFIELLIQEKVLVFEDIRNAINAISSRLKKDNAISLAQLECHLEEVLISIEHFANNTNEVKPVGLNAGTIIETFVRTLRKVDFLKSTTFHVFIDEYENFSNEQQVIINTLLKQSNNELVYDFGVITKGIYSFNTSSDQEIRQKDDFVLHSTDRLGYNSSMEYNTLIKEICRKRLKNELSGIIQSPDDKFFEIDFYLKSFGNRYNEDLLKSHTGLTKIKSRIRSEIEKQAKQFKYTEDEIKEYYEILTTCSPVPLRIHLALLLRTSSKVVPAKNLVNHKITQSPVYKEWMHNMGSAAIILLCHELNVDKKYHGYRVFSALSSGVIRSFLELAEYAFDYAFNSSDKFSFKSPRELTVDEQTKAVYFVSKLKLNEIDSYEPHGFRLKAFTIALGQIFHAIQTNSDATLGEVEQNHFITKVSDLNRYSPEASKLLQYAVRYKILEEEEPTKTKSEDAVEFIDYHLNHIYCPAFGISHLRKRKIPISHLDLARLFCGTHKELEESVRKLSGFKEDTTLNLFSPDYDLSGEV